MYHRWLIRAVKLSATPKYPKPSARLPSPCTSGGCSLSLGHLKQAEYKELRWPVTLLSALHSSSPLLTAVETRGDINETRLKLFARYGRDRTLDNVYSTIS